MASATQLSKTDAAVLSALFDPEASLTGAPDINPSASNSVYSASTFRQIQDLERKTLLLINSENPSYSDIQNTITELSNLLTQYPEYASAYNNRAQAQRMLLEVSACPTPQEYTSSLSTILSDLARAIDLATPIRPTDSISPEAAKVLASAHTHRAFILYRASKSEVSRKAMSGVKGMESLDAETLEEMASRDFGIGGRYGNNMAKQLAVQTNPYAKLCGSIVKEALRKEMESFNEGRVSV